MTGWVEKNPLVKKLLLLLSDKGMVGVRLDLLDSDFHHADLLTVLDDDKLIEFGFDSHGSYGDVKNKPSGRIHWQGWATRGLTPLTQCLTKVLEHEPETMRPWIRTTNLGHALTSRIKLAAGSGTCEENGKTLTTKELATLVDKTESTIRGWLKNGLITAKKDGKPGVETRYDLKATTEQIKKAIDSGKIRSVPREFDT